MTTTLADIKDTFDLLDDWADRYAFLIELGDELPPFPDELRSKEHKVKGCMSQVWVVGSEEDGRMHYLADSDAHIVRGLVALVRLLFEGKSKAEVVAMDVNPVLAELGLDKHLSPGRSNGLHSMIKKIKRLAS